MFEHTRAAPTGLHRHATASLGARGSLLTGEGTEHARLVRLVLLGYTRWPGRPQQDPWPSDATLALRAGLKVNEVERALISLRRAGIVATRIGVRPGARRRVGRLIDVRLGSPCKALIPEGHDVRNLWDVVRAIRPRGAALVTMMVGAFMLASDAAGGAIDEWSALGCSMADWRRFIGHKKNASWSKRVRELEAAGLIRRDGRRVEISPPRAWFALAVEAAEELKASERLASVVPLRPGPEPEAVAELPEPARLVSIDTFSAWIEDLTAPTARTGTDGWASMDVTSLPEPRPPP